MQCTRTIRGSLAAHPKLSAMRCGLALSPPLAFNALRARGVAPRHPHRSAGCNRIENRHATLQQG